MSAAALEPAPDLAGEDAAALAAAQARVAAGLLGAAANGGLDAALVLLTRLAHRLAELRPDAPSPVVPQGRDPISAFSALLAFHRAPRALAATSATDGLPVVTAVTPNAGSAFGGDAVTVTGSGFTGATAVTFGARQATAVTVVSDAELACITPPVSGTGVVDVAVSTPAGPSSPGRADRFAYAHDVHQAFSMLADHPALLPLLGLTVDLELAPTALPPAALAGAPGRLRVHPLAPDGEELTGAKPPWSAYRWDGADIFAVASNDPQETAETVAGFLNLAQPDIYDLLQIDVDHAGLAMTSAVQDDSEATGVPSVQTAGISLIRSDHAGSLSARFRAAGVNDGALADPGSLTLFDADVVRGYRIDVGELEPLPQDPDHVTWRSLHQRTGTFTFTPTSGAPILVPDPDPADEGHAQPAIVDYPDRDPGTTYVHESLAHWRGWSLSVPRPGRTVGDDGPTDPPAAGPVAGGFQLDARYDVPAGTLPRLRYGHRYRIRARVVDLAGRSLSVSEADAVLADLGPEPVLAPPSHDPTNPPGLLYRRFEPVISPVLVARERPPEGESIERLVLRSNVSEDAATCAQRLRDATAGRNPVNLTGYLPVNERHIVPPKISHSTVEASGLFDGAIGATGSPAAAYTLASRDGTLEDAFVVDGAGDPVPIPPSTGVDPVTGATVTRDSVERMTDGGSAGLVLHHEDALALPYLPDPLARGAVFFGLPGVPTGTALGITPDGSLAPIAPLTPSAGLPGADATTLASLGSMTQIDFGDAWPDRLPFRLRLAEGQSGTPPQWDGVGRVLTVFLNKAEQASVRIASFIAEDDTGILGQWGWLADTLPAGALDTNARAIAAGGALWLLTPPRTITLVHAVQQPLTPPQASVSALRGPGDTGAFLGGTIAVHGHSSAKVDLFAEWSETIDDPNQTTFRVLSFRRHVYEAPIGLPGDLADAPPPAGREPIATYDPAEDVLRLVAPASPPAQTISTNGNGGNGKPPGKPPSPPRVYTSRQEFGDTKHRSVRYSAVATSRFREYFPPEVTSPPDAVTADGPAAAPVEIPSSARPAAPRVLACLPTLRWDPAPEGAFGTRVRHGGGLRILLERPWFSSGEGELLGVVLAQPANYPPDDRARPYVSHWGADPIWASDPVAPLSTAQFPGAQLAGAVVLPELGQVDEPAAVDVAGYAVSFDDTRGVWYADIQIDAGTSYAPLVRLALARYQPSSVDGLKLSPAVAADLVAPLPDRIVTTSADTANPSRILLRVDGDTFVAGSWPGPPEIPDDAIDVKNVMSLPDLIEVTVEQRIPGGVDEAGWRAPSAADLGVQIEIASAVPATGTTDPTLPLWDGAISVPASTAPGDLRIAIREREHLTTDALVPYSYVEIIEDDQGHRHREVNQGTYRPGAGRIVFAETIVL